jgi:hypothetical protein
MLFLSRKDGIMQPYDEQHTLSFLTDTAAPVTPVPIFYLHDGTHPFCLNHHCLCHIGEARMRELLHGVLNRSLRLREVQHGAISWEVK